MDIDRRTVLAGLPAAAAFPLPKHAAIRPNSARAVYYLMRGCAWAFDEIYLPRRRAFHRAIVLLPPGARFESDPQPRDPHALKLTQAADWRITWSSDDDCAAAARGMAKRLPFIRSAHGYTEGMIFFGPGRQDQIGPMVLPMERLFSPEQIEALQA